jgi:drug/metabolite transporter (DMT)-like permease
MTLIGLTAIWGATFTIVHGAVRSYPPVSFLALRSGIAALVLLPVLVRRRSELARTVGGGAALGVLLFGGFATQTMGLALTTPARAGFITGLSVALVPLIGLAFGQRPPRRAVLGVLLAFVGLTIVSFGCQWGLPGCGLAKAPTTARMLGDALVLACAVFYAFQIVGVSHFTARLDPLLLNAVQLLVVAALSAVIGSVWEHPQGRPEAGVWAAAAFVGLVATALVTAVWFHCQRHTTATHAALILSLEPVFAALFSWLWTREAMTTAIWLGGGLMVIGIVAAEIRVGPRDEAPTFLRWLADDPMAH